MSTSDLVTTSEAAEILRCSRQHVVDLCDSGRLPYTRIGTHRRIHRTDLEPMTDARSLRREERRSLWLHRVVAGKVVIDPEEAISTARQNIERMRRAEPRASAWLDAWETVLAAGPEAVVNVLNSTTRSAVELRQNTPFAGLLSDRERRAALASFAVGDPRAAAR